MVRTFHEADVVPTGGHLGETLPPYPGRMPIAGTHIQVYPNRQQPAQYQVQSIWDYSRDRLNDESVQINRRSLQESSEEQHESTYLHHPDHNSCIDSHLCDPRNENSGSIQQMNQSVHNQTYGSNWNAQPQPLKGLFAPQFHENAGQACRSVVGPYVVDTYGQQATQEPWTSESYRQDQSILSREVAQIMRHIPAPNDNGNSHVDNAALSNSDDSLNESMNASFHEDIDRTIEGSQTTILPTDPAQASPSFVQDTPQYASNAMHIHDNDVLGSLQAIPQQNTAVQASPVVAYQCPSSSSRFGEGNSTSSSSSSSSQKPNFVPLSPTSSSIPGPILCGECKVVFKGKFGKGNHARHKRLKHGKRERIFRCEDDNCPKSFKRTDARLKHYRKYHIYLTVGPFVPYTASLPGTVVEDTSQSFSETSLSVDDSSQYIGEDNRNIDDWQCVEGTHYNPSQPDLFWQNTMIVGHGVETQLDPSFVNLTTEPTFEFIAIQNHSSAGERNI